MSIDVLRGGFLSLKKRAAAGVDAMTWDAYAETLEENLQDLHRRVQTGAYRALPSRRVFIPKADGKQRPLGIASIEDTIVQAALVMILTPIYEAQFLGFSYGFRPGRSQHDALDALAFGIKGRYIWWVIDADIRRFFGSIPHAQLMTSVARRVVDRQILHLLKMWLEAAVEETDDQGRTRRTTWNKDSKRGIPPGSPLSPLLSNLYMRRLVFWCKRLGYARRFDARIVCLDAFENVLARDGYTRYSIQTKLRLAADFGASNRS